jgi:hypothetical protein
MDGRIGSLGVTGADRHDAPQLGLRCCRFDGLDGFLNRGNSPIVEFAGGEFPLPALLVF